MTRRLIRTQLNLLLLAVALPLVTLLAYTIYEDLVHDQQQAGESVSVLARSVAGDVGNVMAEADDLLDRLEQRVAGQALGPAECERVIDDLMRIDSRFHAVVTSRAGGAVVCERHGSGEAARVRPLLAQAERIGSMAADAPRAGLFEHDGTVHAVRSRTLWDAAGRVAGVVSVLVDVQRYALARDLSLYPPGTSVEIRDAAGSLLFRTPGSSGAADASAPSGIAKVMTSEPARGVARGEDGRERLYALAPIRGTEWHAVAGTPTAAIFAPTRQLAIRNSLVALVIIGSVGVVAWGISGRISGPIRRMARAAQTVAGGDLRARVEVSGPAEIAEVAEQFNVMVQARLDAEELLREAHNRLKALSRRLLDVQESERRRIARELHDEVGQALTALSLRLQALHGRIGDAAGGSGLDECTDIADATLRQVRTLCLDLRPPQLDDLGLVSALRWQSDRQCQAAGIAVHLDHSGLPAEPPADAATVCFRVAQEAMTNAVRHSGASSVWIELRADGKRLYLLVRDDGCGFDVAGRRREALRGSSVGLLSMEERVTLAGGSFSIESSPGRGTQVRMSLPLSASKEES